MIVSEKVIQGSEEWLQLRKGRATASEFSRILTPGGKPSESREGYMRQLARECAVDDPMIFMGNKYTEWGHEHEAEARELFMDLTGCPVEEVGFCCREDGVIGCSPDGLMRRAGEWVEGLEIKCPGVDKHVEYLMEGLLPDAYKLQVHGSLAVTGLDVWHFMSYFPGLNPLILEIHRDDFTETVSKALDQFLIDYAPERERVLNAILPGRAEKGGLF